VLVSGAIVTSLQYFGYLVALVGVTGYSAYKRSQQQVAAQPKELGPAVDSQHRGKGTTEEQMTLSMALDTEEEDEEAR
jgi:cell division protein FtsB